MIRREIQRNKLRNRNMHLNVARVTVADNPDAIMQRALVSLQLFGKEPMIGGVPQRRHELLKRTLFAMREKDPQKLLPPLKQIMAEAQQAQQQAAQDPAAAKMHENMQDKVGGGGSSDAKDSGMRQGGPDVSVGALGKKGP